MIEGHEISRRAHVYGLKGRRVYLNFSSPQEYSECGFCNYARVMEILNRWLTKCDDQGCSQLIAPFQVRTSQEDGRINKNCIENPIDDLRSRFKVCLVYLRRDSVGFISEVDRLMTQCQTTATIKSRVGRANEQACELLNIVTSV